MLAEVVGQTEAVYLLRRTLEGQLDHPMLLVGDDGVGKRFSVQQFVREAFCTGTKRDGCDCIHCFQLDTEAHPDFITISTPDGKDIGVGFIRDVVQQTATCPTLARRKVFFIDGCDRLTPSAANAFLKTLEEPPRTVHIFLSACSAKRVLPTIRSRCVVANYRRLPAAFIASKLLQIEEDSVRAQVYARLADGSLGRAIRLKMTRCLVLRDRMLQTLVAAAKGDVAQVFIAIDDNNKDLPLALTLLAAIIHDLLLLPHNPQGIVNLDIVSALEKARSSIPPSMLTLFWKRLKVVVDRQERAHINLPFQLKSLFVSMSS